MPVASGLYAVRVDADRWRSVEGSAAVRSGGHENSVSITLRSRPAVAGVTFQDGKFKFRQAIAFKPGGQEIGRRIGRGNATSAG